MYFGAISPLIPLVREGKVRALAVTSAERFGASPDLPTMIEAGFPGFVSILSIGLMAPAGTSPAIIDKIHQDTLKVLALADVRAKLSDIGMEVIGNSPAEVCGRHQNGNAAMGEGHQGRRNQAEQLTFGD